MSVPVGPRAVLRWANAPTIQMTLQVSPAFLDSYGGTNNERNDSRWGKYEYGTPPLPDCRWGALVCPKTHTVAPINVGPSAGCTITRGKPNIYQIIVSPRLYLYPLGCDSNLGAYSSPDEQTCEGPSLYSAAIGSNPVSPPGTGAVV